MAEFNSIEAVAKEIKNKFQNKKVITLYAFNATGKTRLSNEFQEEVEEESGNIILESLKYNAYFEDNFSWDNENNILKTQPNSHIFNIIKDNGLEKGISDIFKSFVRSKLEPNFDFEKGEITFKIASGDDTSLDQVKISRGEESILVWSVFYTILDLVIGELNEDEENRGSNVFNNMKYIVIDDPVSSMDDANIIKIAVELAELIKKSKSRDLNFLITTHHPLFYNVLTNSLKNSLTLVLSKTNNSLNLLKSEKPFGYHLMVIDEIKKAIKNNDIKKYHFGILRDLLEKTASFLGYDKWGSLLDKDKEKEFSRIINSYNHDKLSDLESRDINENDKENFKEIFESFIKNYNFNNE